MRQRAIEEEGEGSGGEDGVIEMPEGIEGEPGERIKVRRRSRVDKEIGGSSPPLPKGGR